MLSPTERGDAQFTIAGGRLIRNRTRQICRAGPVTTLRPQWGNGGKRLPLVMFGPLSSFVKPYTRGRRRGRLYSLFAFYGFNDHAMFNDTRSRKQWRSRIWGDASPNGYSPQPPVSPISLSPIILRVKRTLTCRSALYEIRACAPAAQRSCALPQVPRRPSAEPQSQHCPHRTARRLTRRTQRTTFRRTQRALPVALSAP